MATFNIPPAPSVPLILQIGEQQTINPVWYVFFHNLFLQIGAGQAPITLAQLITYFVNESLTLAVPSWLTVTGSPVGGATGINGTLTIASASEAANLFLASPSGSSGVLSPRAIATLDLASVLLGAAQGGTGINNGAKTLTFSNSMTLAASADGETLNIAAGGTLGTYAFLSAGPLTNSLGSDVALNDITLYFDGPSVAQGTTGTWFASGTVTLQDTAGTAAFNVKLWDGTTVIASTVVANNGAGSLVSASLSGIKAAPAANIRISAQDTTSTSGKIIFNASGTSKDSTVTAFRIV